MKLRIAVPIFAALAAFSLLAQETAPPATKVPVKVGAPSNLIHHESTDNKAVAPSISTAKLWRLVAKTQALRVQANETPQAKEAAASEAELQAEQQKLSAICGAAFTLGYQEDKSAPNSGDLICVPKPKEQAAVTPPVAAKEK